jgi:hypothetical protein
MSENEIMIKKDIEKYEYKALESDYESDKDSKDEYNMNNRSSCYKVFCIPVNMAIWLGSAGVFIILSLFVFITFKRV